MGCRREGTRVARDSAAAALRGGGDVTGCPADMDRRDTRMAIEPSLLSPLFEAGGVAIVATDIDGRVTALSPPAEELLGFSEPELAGSLFHDRVHSTRPDGSPLPAEECPLIVAIREARSAAGEGEVFV